MKNTFGSALALTIFGESHGRAIGGVLDGMAAGVPVDECIFIWYLTLNKLKRLALLML